MKVGIITDMHIGARSDSIHYLNYFKRFYDNIFFPTIDDRGIDTVLDLGDTLDRRKYINFKTLSMFNEMWMTPLTQRNITLHAIVGNHQTYYRNTNDINSADLLMNDVSKNYHIYTGPTEIELDGRKILMLPWVNRENYDESVAAITNSKSPVLMGHLELSGYQMVRGSTCTHGMEVSLFSKFSRVFSGHFHIKQHSLNVDYLGTPYEITFADSGLDKGFHIFDTETLELEFIKNPEPMHIYIPYDDAKVNYDLVNVADYRHKMVKVNVIHKSDAYVFEKFIDRLIAAEPIKYTIIDTEEMNRLAASEDSSVESRDTMDILTEYVSNNYSDTHDRTKITTLMRELYNEAIAQQ